MSEIGLVFFGVMLGFLIVLTLVCVYASKSKPNKVINFTVTENKQIGFCFVLDQNINLILN